MRRLLVFLLLVPLGLSAETKESAPADELRFPNGEIARGHFVGKDGEYVVFESKNFGKLRVLASSVTVVTEAEQARQAKAAPAQTPEREGKPAGDKEASKKATWASVHLPNWHGGMDLALEMRRETSLKSNFYSKAYVSRETDGDSVKLDGSWEHTVEDKKTTVDVTKGNGYWRHDLTPKYFTVYAPTLEWNRSYEHQSAPVDYLLTRQQIGIGRTLRKRKTHSIRVGVAENFFNVWLWTSNRVGQAHAFVESAFLETDIVLPLGMHIVERGNFYYERSSGDAGWENDLELSKNLRSNLRIGLRNEARQNVPGVQNSNYNLWRLFLGLEF